MTPTCTNCGSQFALNQADDKFFAKVGPVTPPTMCPTCRVQRRMAWRNDRSFYHRKCDLSGQAMISIYPAGTPFPVYHPSEWYGDKWNALDYGREYDFSKSFFAQWHELMQVVPRLGIDIVNCENSDYCNYCGDDKNCYLDIAGEANEDCFFNLFTKHSTSCVDCTFAYHCELCYECIQCYQSYSCRHSMYLEDCSDCAFCYDCKGCRNCLLCTNLRQQEYCIMNEQLSKQEYEAKLKELNLTSHQAVKQVQEIWQKMRLEKGLYRDMYNLNCENCQGNNLKNSRNCQWCFNASNCEDCQYLYDVLDAKDCQDLNYSLYSPEVSCELISTLAMKFSAFCMASHYCSNCYYCDLCNNSTNLFGCIGLNQKNYCILNKEYSEADYKQLVPQIIQQMKSSNEWSQFFPLEICPFGYNETVAQEYLPLSKEDVLKRGWLWRDEEPTATKYSGPATTVADDITDVDDALGNEVLICEVTGKPYKLIPQELKFYKQLGLPVPRRCPEQRHLDRTALRNARWLWPRACAQCGQEMITSYQPERPERVVCEPCYLAAVH